MRWTIARAIVVVGLGLLASLTLTVGLSTYALYQLRVGGPNYDKIVAGKDLVADILPPPLYIVEAYLEARLVLDRPQEVNARKERFGQLRKDFDERKAIWEASLLIPGELRDDLTKAAAGEALKFWSELERNFLPAIERGQLPVAQELFAKLTTHYDAHRVVIDRVVTQANAFAAAVEAESNAQKSTLEGIVFASAGLMLLLLGAAIILLKRQVARPILVLADYLTSLAHADYGTPVPFQARADEIGRMSKAVVKLKDAAMDRERLERDSERACALAEAERAAREAERTEEARQSRATIDALAGGLDRIANGDLECRIDTPFAANAEKLRNDFNASIEKLRQTMLSIAACAGAMNSGTQEISTASNDLSHRTEQQASSLQETAAALEEITATVRKAAEGVSHARAVVAGTKEDAEKSGEVVRRAVEAMGGIEKSSQQIGQIIGVIDEIAFQTNLLALNAGVEAARAGDAGRGFAVVASEVRALAQRSAEAAKEIKALISTSTAQVGSGVQLVGETGQSLERIVAKVAEINTIVSDIAAGAQEQATGLQQVNTAVNEMDKVTQQNSAMAEEAIAAGRSLAQEAGQLSSLVGQFRLGSVAQFEPPRRAAVKGGPPHQPEPAAKAYAPKRQLKVSGGRRDAVARQPNAEVARAGDGWQDF
jgi:methyl-accepting chemotaxis protein